LPEFLRRLADYLEAGAYSDNGTYYVHPSEVPRKPKISKRQYNKLKKEYLNSGKRAKFPEYPKTGRSKKLLGLFETYNIEPYN